MSVLSRRIEVEDAPFGRVGERCIVLNCGATAYSSFKPRAAQRPSVIGFPAPQSTHSELSDHRFPNAGERDAVHGFGE